MNKKAKIVIIASTALLVGGIVWFVFAEDKRKKKYNGTVLSPKQARDLIRKIALDQ